MACVNHGRFRQCHSKTEHLPGLTMQRCSRWQRQWSGRLSRRRWGHQPRGHINARGSDWEEESVDCVGPLRERAGPLGAPTPPSGLSAKREWLWLHLSKPERTPFAVRTGRPRSQGKSKTPACGGCSALVISMKLQARLTRLQPQPHRVLLPPQTQWQ